jgi:hypothetical protein
MKKERLASSSLSFPWFAVPEFDGVRAAALYVAPATDRYGGVSAYTR